MNNDLSKPKILIVDDAPANLEILSETLMPDYDVSVCKSGREALELMAANAFDLVLLDVMLDAMDGYEVCKRIKSDENTTNIPVIFVSAKAEVNDEIKGFELGAADFISKPFRPVLVLARVKRQLESKHLRDNLGEIARKSAAELDAAKQKLESEIESRKMAEHELEKMVREKNEAFSQIKAWVKSEIPDPEHAGKLIGSLSKMPWFQ